MLRLDWLQEGRQQLPFQLTAAQDSALSEVQTPATVVWGTGSVRVWEVAGGFMPVQHAAAGLISCQATWPKSLFAATSTHSNQMRGRCRLVLLTTPSHQALVLGMNFTAGRRTCLAGIVVLRLQHVHNTS